jgi:dihydrofolate reductase
LAPGDLLSEILSESTLSADAIRPLSAGKLTLIAGVAQNGVIGRDNQLPWRLPEDLKFFKQATLGRTIVMGRKTFDSIGRPLPGRRNLVVSRDSSRSFDGVEFCASLAEAISRCAPDEEVFVIGGAGLYQEALPWADRLLITRIERDFEGDTRFPAIPAAFLETTRRPGVSSTDPSLHFAFVEYRRA